MDSRKVFGIVFSCIGLLFSMLFLVKTDLNINLKSYFDFTLKSYFSLSYLNKILPLINCLMLMYGGVLLIFKPTKSNLVLALFGVTVIEEIIFNILGLNSIVFPVYIVFIFFSCAICSLWISYTDNINQKKLSFKEGVYSLFLGTIINAISYYFFLKV